MKAYKISKAKPREGDGRITWLKTFAPKNHDDAERELKCLNALSVPGDGEQRILQLLDVKVVKKEGERNETTLTFPNCGTNLQSLLASKLTAAIYVKIVKQILEGYAHIHRRNFIHNSVSLRNVLVNSLMVTLEINDISIKLKNFENAQHILSPVSIL